MSNMTNIATSNTGIDMIAANALVAAGTISADDLELALDAQHEQSMLVAAHPDPEDQFLHKYGQCDGTCTRFRCFR